MNGETPNRDLTLTVNEIFYSLQGESTHAGLPCVFIRLTACHLRCRYCDSEYSFYEGQKMRLEDILDVVAPYQCRLVEITGGEPLLQPNVYCLIEMLQAGGYQVMIETSGSLSVERLNPNVIKILDLKCPSSGESARNDFSNLDYLTVKDEVKFVIGDHEDYQWARAIVEKFALTQRVTVLFSPVYQKLPPSTLAEWILRDHLPVRLQIQLHKAIWGERRGV
ncbi:MAG: radical SAM protein [Acidobacteria bacterium]|nr:radical SAM protein [Acidobacteriota bacterium]